VKIGVNLTHTWNFNSHITENTVCVRWKDLQVNAVGINIWFHTVIFIRDTKTHSVDNKNCANVAPDGTQRNQQALLD
jgi:hypothetical protein